MGRNNQRKKHHNCELKGGKFTSWMDTDMTPYLIKKEVSKSESNCTQSTLELSIENAQNIDSSGFAEMGHGESQIGLLTFIN